MQLRNYQTAEDLFINHRVLYPELVFGAIASSGVTHATLVLWEYMEVIRRAADPECSKRLQTSIEAIDYILLNMPHLRKPLKSLFGLADLEHDDDFASLLSVREMSRYDDHDCLMLRTFRVHLGLGRQRTGILQLAAPSLTTFAPSSLIPRKEKVQMNYLFCLGGWRFRLLSLTMRIISRRSGPDTT